MGPWEETAGGGGGPLVLASRWRWIGVERDGVRVRPCSVGCRYPHLSFFVARSSMLRGRGDMQRRGAGNTRTIATNGIEKKAGAG